MANFSQILSTPRAAIEAPKPLPVGTYQVRVGVPKQTESRGENPRAILEFPLTVLAAESDVDAEQLEEFGGSAKITKVKSRVSFWLQNDDGELTLHQLDKFLQETCGIEKEDGQSLSEAVSRANGSVILAHMKHRVNKNDPNQIFAEVDATAPLAD